MPKQTVGTPRATRDLLDKLSNNKQFIDVLVRLKDKLFSNSSIKECDVWIHAAKAYLPEHILILDIVKDQLKMVLYDKTTKINYDLYFQNKKPYWVRSLAGVREPYQSI